MDILIPLILFAICTVGAVRNFRELIEIGVLPTPYFSEISKFCFFVFALICIVLYIAYKIFHQWTQG